MMKTTAVTLLGTSRNSWKYGPPNTRARAPAAAMLAASMQNVTINVRMRLPNALCTYRAAPAAWGYLVMSSA